MSLHKKLVIFFDGECVLCHGVVDFVHSRDDKDIFYYSPLSSDFAKSTLSPESLKLDTVQVIDNNLHLIKSDAALHIMNTLFNTKLFNLCKIIPKVVRDGIYDFVAKIRYRIFGRNQNCLYDPSLTKKIIYKESESGEEKIW